MWIFCRMGFFSAVCAKQQNVQGVSKHAAPIDVDMIMIRARHGKHLEAIKKAFPEVLGGFEIKMSPNNDYRFRMIVPKDVFAQFMARLAFNCNYGNFKSEYAYQWGKDLFEVALHKVWGILYGIQCDEFGGGIFGDRGNNGRREADRKAANAQAELEADFNRARSNETDFGSDVPSGSLFKVAGIGDDSKSFIEDGKGNVVNAKTGIVVSKSEKTSLMYGGKRGNKRGANAGR